MITITVTYPSDSGSKFDVDYYLQKHIPLVKQKWAEHGLTHVKVVRGLAKADGSAPDYQIMAILSFGSLEGFKAAGKLHGKEIFADIPNFTDLQATIQINENIG